MKKHGGENGKKNSTLLWIVGILVAIFICVPTGSSNENESTDAKNVKTSGVDVVSELHQDSEVFISDDLPTEQYEQPISDSEQSLMEEEILLGDIQSEETNIDEDEIIADEVQKPEFSYEYCYREKYPNTDIEARDKPNSSGNIVAIIPKNEKVIVTGQCNETGWYRIKFEDRECYANNIYLQERKTYSDDNGIEAATVGTIAFVETVCDEGNQSEINAPVQREQTIAEDDLEVVPSDPMYIGNINNMKLHSVFCRGQLPKEKNRVYFYTLEEAAAAGYTKENQCHNCWPFGR